MPERTSRGVGYKLRGGAGLGFDFLVGEVGGGGGDSRKTLDFFGDFLGEIGGFLLNEVEDRQRRMRKLGGCQTYGDSLDLITALL